MILLSQVSPGMNLAGRYLYFTRVIPTDAVDGSYSLGKVDAVRGFTLRIRSVSTTKYLEYTYDGIAYTLINDSVNGWNGIFNWQRMLKLDDALNPVEPNQEPAQYTWLPYIYFVSVCDSKIDRPVMNLQNIASQKQPAYTIERSLADVNEDEDLTGKIIVFDPDTIYRGANRLITIGNPLPDNPGDVSWYIKFTMYTTSPGQIYEITAGVNGVQIIQFYMNQLGWIQNWIDLRPHNPDERFIFKELPGSLEPAVSLLEGAYVCSRSPQKSTSTTIEIVKGAARRMHLPEPPSVEIISPAMSSSDSNNAKLLLSSLNQTLKSLAVFANWPQMFKEVQFYAIKDSRYGYNDTIGGFDLDFLCPSYDGIVSPFVWAIDSKVAIPESTEREFYEPSERIYYRIVANHICFNSDINQMVRFTYKTKYIVIDVSGQPKEYTDSDDDECIFDSEVCILGTIVSFKSAIGQDPTIETNLFDRYTLHMTQIIGSPTVIPSGR